MKKIWFIPLLTLTLYAQDFESFKHEALQNSPYLRANALKVQSAVQKSEITTRYQNPTLGLEASQFAQDGISSNENGYRVELTQPIRLWGVGSAREELGDAQQRSAKQNVVLTKASFIRELSLQYVAYKRLVHLKKLALQELEIAQKIASISRARFENGTIAKVKYLQAKMDTQRIENNVNTLDVAQTDAYYNLLAFAGMKSQTEIDSEHHFEMREGDKTAQSPELEYLSATTQLSVAKAKLNENKLEWIDLRAEFENEPDQDIYRVGVNIPLVIFNQRTQEKQLAQLQGQQQTLLYENKKRANDLTLKKIAQMVEKLSSVEQSTQVLQQSQQKLLEMYEDGYKIANINLIELQLIKNQMIATQERLIEIQTQKEKNIIEYNYLTGAYND